MELELKKASADAYETGGELVLTQEETEETILPDYCPDIARVIESDGTVFLHNREARDGQAELRGSVQVHVLYTPEGESGIRGLEFAVPFVISCEGHELDNCQILDAEIETEYLETRMLNPRKLFTHCKLIARVTGYHKRPLLYCSGVETEESWRVEKRLENRRAVLLTQAAEREFTFSDTMSLSPGRPGAMELLSTRVTPSVNETRMIGNKLIFKGIFTLSLLYRAEDGECASCTGELPFSQIMDVDHWTDGDARIGADAANANTREAENAWVSVRVDLTGWDLQIDGADPDGRQIAVTLYLYAMAALRQERELTLLTDLYSTKYNLSYDSALLRVTRSYNCLTRRQSVRELLEIGVVVDSILSVRVSCGPVTASREGDAVILRAAASIRALYRDEGGAALVAERRVEVSCRLELPEDAAVTARAVCPEEPRGSVGERGIEVRFPVDFQLEAVSVSKEICVTAAELDVNAPKDTASAPSLVLRGMEPGETFWDLAKAYNSTIGEIASANHMDPTEGGELPRLLLIPRKRA